MNWTKQSIGWDRTWTLVCLSVPLLAFAPGQAGAGQQSSATARLDSSAFKIITDRNIFNARRSGGRSSSGPRETSRPARVEVCKLVGTMDYDKGALAFFDGTSSEFRKALKAEETIAGYKITEILPNGVKMDAGTNKLELWVGMNLRREDEGEWHLSTRAESYESGGGGSSSRRSESRDSHDSRDYRSSRGSSSTSASPPSTVSAAEVNEVLKRLMEKREKENQ